MSQITQAPSPGSAGQVSQTPPGPTLTPGQSSPQPQPESLLKVVNRMNQVVRPLLHPTLSGAVNAIEVGGDAAMVYRCNSDWIQMIPGTEPMAAALGTPAGATVYHGFGLGVVVSAAGVALGLPRTYSRAARAEEVGDGRGWALGSLALARDVSLIGGLVIFGGAYRGTAVASALSGVTTGFTAPTLLGRITGAFSTLGLALLTVFYAFAGVVLGLNIYEGEKLKNSLKLDEQNGLQAQLARIEKKLTVDLVKLEAKLKKELGPNYKTALVKEAIAAGAANLHALLEELGITTSDPLGDIYKNILAAELQNRGATESVGQMLALIGFDLRARKLEIKKTDKLSRVLGEDLVKTIKGTMSESTPLSARIANDASALQQGQDLVQRVQKVLSENVSSKMPSIIQTAVGLTAIVLCTIFTAGAGLVVGVVLMAISSLMSLVSDYIGLQKSVASEEKGAIHDKKLLTLSILVNLAIVATIVALHVAGILTLGIAPLVVMIVLSAIWLGYNLYALHVIERKEDAWKKAHPTLEDYLAAVTAGDRGKMLEIPARLPPELRAKVEEAAFSKPGADLRAVIEQTIQQIKDEELQRKESLRQALDPFINSNMQTASSTPQQEKGTIIDAIVDSGEQNTDSETSLDSAS